MKCCLPTFCAKLEPLNTAMTVELKPRATNYSASPLIEVANYMVSFKSITSFSNGSINCAAELDKKRELNGRLQQYRLHELFEEKSVLLK